MTMIVIKKNPNRRVRIPESGEQLHDGEEYEVADSPYWRRRIQSADVFEVQRAEPEDAGQNRRGRHAGGNAKDDVSRKSEKSESQEEAAKSSTEQKTDDQTVSETGKEESGDKDQTPPAADQTPSGNVDSDGKVNAPPADNQMPNQEETKKTAAKSKNKK